VSRLSLVFVAALVLGACGDARVPSPSESASAEPPLDPGVLGLTCGDGQSFHPALLAMTGRAETDPDAAAEALRATIVTRPIPASGWIRVVQVADRVLFLAPMAGGPGFAAVGLQFRDGDWRADLGGRCQPEVVIPPGVSRAEWRLDPDFPAPAHGDRQIHVLINERACASGQSPEGRVLPPLVTRSQAAVTIVILVTHRPGGRDCPGNPEFAIAIDLPEPLAGRPLFDGATFSPTGPVVAYALTCEVEGEACRSEAATIVAEAERQHPGRRVAWLNLYDIEGGFFDLGFDDGTSINRHP